MRRGSNTNFYKRGFSLVELLVVVSIIGLLSSVVIATVSNVRVKAKEAKVKAEVHNIRLAFESYATEHGGYPNPGIGLDETLLWCIGDGNCQIAGTLVTNNTNDEENWQIALLKNLVPQNIQYLAAVIFPNFPDSAVFEDVSGSQNKGYVYAPCNLPKDQYPVCPENPATDDEKAYLIYSKADNVVAVEVFGSFREQTCNPEINDICDDPPPEGGGGSQCTGTFSPDCSGGTDYPSCSVISGCAWGGGSTSYCTGSPGVTCGEQNEQPSCESHIGCTWQDATSGQCGGAPTATCGAADNTSCTAIAGCSWGGGTPNTCSGSPIFSCTGFDNNSCNSQSGCSWTVETIGSCSGTPTATCNAGDDTSCNSVSGCSWGWDWLSLSYGCSGTPNATCSGSYSSCIAVAGCYWQEQGSTGSCSGTYTNGFCDGSSPSSCSSTPGCSWTDATLDSCSGTPTAACDGDENSCSTVSGCSWEGGSPAQCTGTISCGDLGNYNDCEDRYFGCEWIYGGSSYCSTDPTSSCSGFSEEDCQNAAASGCEWSG